VRNTRRETGRIYKISYGRPSAVAVDVAALDNDELVNLQLHQNDWHVRHARRVLQERATAGRDMTAVRESLHAMFANQEDVTRRLRALWTLHVVGGLDDEFLIQQLNDESEYIRGWAVRLLCEDKDPPVEALDRFREMAAADESAYVRLHLACALQRLELGDRWPIAEALASRGEDAGDQNLPLMIWYGVAPLVEEDLSRYFALAADVEIPLVQRHIVRRAVSSHRRSEALEELARVLRETDKRDVQSEVLAGALQGLEGIRSAEAPTGWSETYAQLQSSPDEAVRELSLQLALTFDDPAALELLRRQAADEALPAATRLRAVQALVAKRAAELTPLLFGLLNASGLQSAALRGLAEYDDPATAAIILDAYDSFDAAARQDALQTLASRRTWATALLDAVESGGVPRTDLTAYTARQLQTLEDEEITARLRTLWGEVRETPEEKARLIADFKKRLTPETLERADRSAGRLLFEKTCANCHRLFDAGGTIGPDITGAQRTNLDYLLENLIDPSAAVSKDYQMEVIVTTAGRVVTGLVLAENDNAVTVQSANERLVIPADEIDDRRLSPLSMMPDGVLQQLSSEQLRDLFAYLTGATQAPPAESHSE
ncbi:MAG: c-type cytochrome, partial [Planctomycetes bacterium]|nr:c-type cytochrome [Planctomycetota bacterium]